MYENPPVFQRQKQPEFWGAGVKPPVAPGRRCRSRSCRPVPAGVRRAQPRLEPVVSLPDIPVLPWARGGRTPAQTPAKAGQTRREAQLAHVCRQWVPKRRRLSLGLAGHPPAGGPGQCQLRLSPAPAFRAFRCRIPPDVWIWMIPDPPARQRIWRARPPPRVFPEFAGRMLQIQEFGAGNSLPGPGNSCCEGTFGNVSFQTTRPVAKPCGTPGSSPRHGSLPIPAKSHPDGAVQERLAVYRQRFWPRSRPVREFVRYPLAEQEQPGGAYGIHTFTGRVCKSLGREVNGR